MAKLVTPLKDAVQGDELTEDVILDVETELGDEVSLTENAEMIVEEASPTKEGQPGTAAQTLRVRAKLCLAQRCMDYA